jgi:hypothetical protein
MFNPELLMVGQEDSFAMQMLERNKLPMIATTAFV